MRFKAPPAIAAVVGLGLAAGLAAAVPASADQAVPRAAFADFLSSVTAITSSDAWAVGIFDAAGHNRTLIEHWNGHSWTIIASPDPGKPGTDDVLAAVAATSSSNAWAVGAYGTSASLLTLTAHWNGHSWQTVKSPNPAGTTAGQNILASVAATSTSNAWAVGSYTHGSTLVSMILHWNGLAWHQVPSPQPADSTLSALASVTAISASDAWAVGRYNSPSATHTLVEHWDGHSWRIVPSPDAGSPATGSLLNGIGGSSAGNLWAVGESFAPGAIATLTEHWNGVKWHVVPSPNPAPSGNDDSLAAVTVVSSSNAWATGNYVNGPSGPMLPMILHWNGTTWHKQAVKLPAGSKADLLFTIARAPSGRAWAAGYIFTGPSALTLIEQWNGTAWHIVPSPNK